MISYGDFVFWLFAPIAFGALALHAATFLGWFIVKMRDAFTFDDNKGIF